MPNRLRSASNPEMAPGTVGGVHTVPGYAIDNQLITKELGRPRRRRPSGRVERKEPLFLGHPDEREEVATDPGVVLRGHVQHRRGGHGRVDGVASIPEDLQSRLRGQWIARRHDPVPGQHL